MSPTPTVPGPGGPGWCRIRVHGHLDQRWTSWFDGLTLTPEPDGTTVLEGRVADQAALHGLLGKVRDMGLPLVSVTRDGAGDLPGGGTHPTTRQEPTP